MIIAIKCILDARWYLAGHFYLDDTVEIKHIWRNDDGPWKWCSYKVTENNPRDRIVTDVTLTTWAPKSKTYKVRNPRHIFDYPKPPHPLYGI